MDFLGYLSERSRRFHPNLSFDSQAHYFETKTVKGCVFYLPREGQKGGDAFVICEKEFVTVALLDDMTGHGKVERKRIQPYLKSIDAIAECASRVDDSRLLLEMIAYLDKDTDVREMMAFSLIRIKLSCIN